MVTQRKKPVLIRAACQYADGSVKMTTTRMDDIRPNPTPFHAHLPPRLRERARAVYPRLGKIVTPMAMSKWLDGFRYDMHPGNEIGKWEQMADTFEALGGPAMPPDQGRAFARATVMVSSGVVDVPAHTGLSDEVVAGIRTEYERQELCRYESARPDAVSVRRLSKAMDGDWRGRRSDEREMIECADVIIAVDPFRSDEMLMHGRELCEQVIATGVARESGVAYVAADFDNEWELDFLEAAILAIKGL